MTGATMSASYTERLRTCEAHQVTPENAAAVAEWCSGHAMDNGVRFPVGEVLVLAPFDWYIVREGDRLTTQTAADFEARWAPAEDE